jgi:hypothetical protein
MISEPRTNTRDVRHTPVDGFPTSTSKIQQETEIILSEHGITDGGWSLIHLRAGQIAEGIHRTNVTEKRTPTVPSKKYDAGIPCSIRLTRCKSAVAFVLDLTSVQCIRSRFGPWK